MSNPCRTCQPMQLLGEAVGDLGDLDLYSLQDDLYDWHPRCPPGYVCIPTVGPYTQECCDGTLLTRIITSEMTPSERLAVAKALAEECALRLPFCEDGDDGDDDGGGGGGGGGGGDISITTYYNNLAVAYWTCGAGQVFAYRIFPGGFSASTQERADVLAGEEAIRQVQLHYFCLSALSTSCCAGTAFSEIIQLTGPGCSGAAAAQFRWSLVSGSLPTGLTLADGWRPGRTTTLSGTPTVAGSYTFTIRAHSTDGCYMDRTYTMCVVDFTPAGAEPIALPDGEVDTAYSQTFAANACASTAAGPLSWQVTAGALPAGLTLDEETGVLSGTPTADGDFTFTITLQTEAT